MRELLPPVSHRQVFEHPLHQGQALQRLEKLVRQSSDPHGHPPRHRMSSGLGTVTLLRAYKFFQGMVYLLRQFRIS